MSRKPDLAAVVEAAGSRRRRDQVQTAPQGGGEGGVARKTPSRVATKQIAAHYPEEVSWQLRELALERRTTVQALVGEALNDLFAKHGRPEIVPIASGKTKSL